MNKTYKYNIASGETREVTFDVGVRCLAISNANGEDGAGNISKMKDVELTDLQDKQILVYDSTDEKWKNEKQLSAGDGIIIDGQTKSISVNNTYIKEIVIGEDPSDFKKYRAEYSVANVSGTTQISLNLVSNPNMVYIVSGSGKDTNNNIIPLTDNEKININFSGQIATVTVAEGITLKLLNFVIEYTLPQVYVNKTHDTQDAIYLEGTLRTYKIHYLKDCFVVYRTGSPYLIAITLDSQSNVIDLPNAFNVHYYTSATTEYTYNEHTIYYGIINTAGSTWDTCIPSIDYDSLTGGELARFSSLNNALQGFITDYFG